MGRNERMLSALSEVPYPAVHHCLVTSLEGSIMTARLSLRSELKKTVLTKGPLHGQQIESWLFKSQDPDSSSDYNAYLWGVHQPCEK